MTVYNINLGIGWASSGVEYAQAYRAAIFRSINQPAKFIFTDFINYENIAYLTENIGFLDQEVIWLYLSFTDFPVGPTTVTLKQLQTTFLRPGKLIQVTDKKIRFEFAPGDWAAAYLKAPGSKLVERVEYVHQNVLYRKDYFTTGRYLSEYYAPLNNKAHLYLRRFFNQDGTIAYEEILDGKAKPCFKFADGLLLSKEALIARFLDQLHLTADDVLIMDRDDGMEQTVLEHRGKAKVGVIVHADHYSVNDTNSDHILWNNFYEYAFDHARDIDFFVTATPAQHALLAKQFKQYTGYTPRIVTIPVGNLAQLRKPTQPRRSLGLMTASRLASEKHVDWLIAAVAIVHQTYPSVTLDIYGQGGEADHLKQMIQDHQATSYIHLMGHRDLTTVYEKYEVYVAASTSEGFGLSLMEAVGSGLAMVGLDVPYGNPTFIQDGQNGALLPYQPGEDQEITIQHLAAGIKRVLAGDRTAQQVASYQIAKAYLRPVVAKQWQTLLKAEEEHD